MNDIKRIFTLLFLLSIICAIMVAESLPIRLHNGKECYVYEVKKGESLYGITRSFQWDEALLLAENPDVASGLKKGDTLFYPVNDVDEGCYRVKMGDTVYSLSGKFNCTVDDIYAENPNSRYGIFEGEIIKIPTPKLQSLSMPEDISDESSASSEFKECEIKAVTTPERDEILHIALLLDAPKGNRDLEFTRGFLTALDKIKKNGKKISFNVLNCVDSIPYSNGALTSADVIVTTSDKDIPADLANFALKQGAKLINVFDVKSTLYESNPSVVNLMTPTARFNAGVAGWVAENYGGHQLVLLGDPDNSDNLAPEIINAFNTPPVVMTFDEMEEPPFQDFDKVLIYCYASKKGDITRALELASSAIEKIPLASIEVMGRPNWVVYADDLSAKLGEAHAMIPTRFYFDATSGKNKEFINAFARTFGHDPIKSFPTYAASGYDTALFIIDGGWNGVPERGLLNEVMTMSDTTSAGAANVQSLIVRFSPFGCDSIVIR